MKDKNTIIISIAAVAVLIVGIIWLGGGFSGSAKPEASPSSETPAAAAENASLEQLSSNLATSSLDSLDQEIKDVGSDIEKL